MPPHLAWLIWFVLLLALLIFDPAKERKNSPAMWLPVIWMFIVGTRFVSQWLGGSMGLEAQALADGNPMDRNISILLILLAFAVLASRSFNWGGFFARNPFLIGYVMFALVSVCWSDFRFIAIKRWFRDLGHYLMVLVVLSDPLPRQAIGTVFRRIGYLIIPLSILLIKYFPLLGVMYNPWTGTETFTGATPAKNTLGMVCLITFVYFFWDTRMRWANRREKATKRILLVNAVFLLMSGWLLKVANCATCKVCLALGTLVMLVAQSKAVKRNPTQLKILLPLVLCMYPLLAFGLNLNAVFTRAVGRDPSFTDRAVIWDTVLNMHTNPLFGTGYESFWLGSRLETIWSDPAIGDVNEAHDGYLEVYLNVGIIGLSLLAGFLFSSYLNICKGLKSDSGFASLRLALWTIALFYNITEAAFKWHLMWLTLLLVTVEVAKRPVKQAQYSPGINGMEAQEVLIPPLEEPTGTHGSSWSSLALVAESTLLTLQLTFWN